MLAGARQHRKYTYTEPVFEPSWEPSKLLSWKSITAGRVRAEEQADKKSTRAAETADDTEAYAAPDRTPPVKLPFKIRQAEAKPTAAEQKQEKSITDQVKHVAGRPLGGLPPLKHRPARVTPLDETRASSEHPGSEGKCQ